MRGEHKNIIKEKITEKYVTTKLFGKNKNIVAWTTDKSANKSPFSEVKNNKKNKMIDLCLSIKKHRKI